MQRLFAVSLLAAALFPATARADWWSDARLAQRGISVAVKREWMTADDAETYRTILARATATWRRLPGLRSSNLAGCLHDVAVQWQAFIAPRALALFSMLDTNATYLGADAMPPDGADIRGADGVVYRAFSGHGLQFHPLANFARLNKLSANGRSTDAAALAAALVGRGIPRGKGVVWEYYFPFAGGTPPWTSGMVQAVGARAFADAGDFFIARRAYLAMPSLVFPLSAGPWIRLYSFSNVAVLNAQLQTAISLASYAQLNQDPGATALARRLLDTADHLFSRFDTGAWSLYSLGGREAPLNYQIFVNNLLKRIAGNTQSPIWLGRAERFDRYVKEPPAVYASRTSGSKDVRVSVWVSKLSHVTVTLAGSTQSSTLSRGSHTFGWGRRGPGHYVVRISAVDQAGNRAAKTFALLVRK